MSDNNRGWLDKFGDAAYQVLLVLGFLVLIFGGAWFDYQYRKMIVREGIQEAQQQQEAAK